MKTIRGLLIGLLLSGSVFADSSVLVYGISKHYNEPNKMNEQNYGLGYEYSTPYNDKIDITAHAMAYKDSYSKLGTQFTVGSRYEVGELKNGRLYVGAVGGIMTGSDFKGIGAYPYAEIMYENVAVRFHYVPPVFNDKSVLALSLRIKL